MEYVTSNIRTTEHFYTYYVLGCGSWPVILYYIASSLWLLNLEILWVENDLYKHDNILAMVVYKNIARQARHLIN